MIRPYSFGYILRQTFSTQSIGTLRTQTQSLNFLSSRSVISLDICLVENALFFHSCSCQMLASERFINKAYKPRHLRT